VLRCECCVRPLWSRLSDHLPLYAEAPADAAGPDRVGLNRRIRRAIAMCPILSWVRGDRRGAA